MQIMKYHVDSKKIILI